MATIEQAAEVHRLAVAGGEKGIAHGLGRALGRWFASTSRFRELEHTASLTLTLGADAWFLNSLATARLRLGDPSEALEFYNQALPIRRDVGDRAGEATTLTNIGSVYNGLGDRHRR